MPPSPADRGFLPVTGASDARDEDAASDAAVGAGPPTRGGLSIGPRQRSALISWAAFTATFGVVRAVTYAVRKQVPGCGDLKAGGVHLHHYLWGIALLALSGGVAVHGRDEISAHPLVAAGWGAGGALVVDEFAMLLHFKDVYWARHGRLSVALAVALIGGIGVSLVVVPLLRRRGHPVAPVAAPQGVTPGTRRSSSVR